MTENESPVGETSNAFVLLITRLQAESMLWLGLIPHPETNETSTDLFQAKSTIDILEMLRRKTEGNRNDEETKALQSVLFELRIRYVEVSRGGASTES